MNRARGLIITADAYGTISKEPTFTCLHCGNLRKSTGDTRNYCSNCDGEVCQDKECSTTCTPFKRKLDEAEARARFHQALRGG